MQSNVTKELVLQPTAPVPLPALLKDSWDSSDTGARKVYTCSSSYHSSCYYSDASGSRCPSCGASMTTALLYADPNSSNSANNSNLASPSGGFVKGVVTNMVMDNLEASPSVAYLHFGALQVARMVE
uniref:Uncharacterized protein n=1 Tax=Opuntia streptacantha TaxID=393608 RepID=A0A7C8ZIZ1_OPUST